MTNNTQLSSSGTFLFKYIIPLGIYFITLMEFVYILVFARFLEKDFLFILIMIFFFLLIVCAIATWLLKHHNVYYNQKETYVESFGKIRKFDNSEIKKVTCFLMYSYKLEFWDKTNKDIWFIAHLNDVLPILTTNRKPYSIKIYEKTLLKHTS